MPCILLTVFRLIFGGNAGGACPVFGIEAIEISDVIEDNEFNESRLRPNDPLLY